MSDVFKSFLETIENYKKALESVPKDKKDKLHKSLDIEFKEQFDYFNLNSQSFASGIIDLNTSQYVYNSLKDWNDTTTQERIAITQLMNELLKRRIAAH